MQTRSTTIKELKEELQRSKEDYHWLDQDRSILRYTLLKNGIDIPPTPNWDYGELDKCQCSYCTCWCDDCVENVIGGNESIYDLEVEEDVEDIDCIYNDIQLNIDIDIETEFCDCIVCKLELVNFGYRKKKIVTDIKVLLLKCTNAIGRECKINNARRIFEYLRNCNKFIEDNDNFKMAVKDKLKEFYVNDNLREARTWHRWLFGARMVLD